VEDLRQQLDACVESIGSLEEAVKRAEDGRSASDAALDEAKSKINGLEGAEKRVGQVSKELMAVKEKNRALEKEVSRLKMENEGLQSRMKVIIGRADRAEEDRSSCEEMLAVVRKEKEEALAEVHRLNVVCSSSSREISMLLGELEAVREEGQRSAGEGHALRVEAAEMRRLLELSRERLRELEKEKVIATPDVEGRLAAEGRVAAEVREEAAALRTTCSSMTGEVERLQMEAERLHKLWETEKTAVLSLQKEVEHLKDMSLKEEKSAASLRQENDALRKWLTEERRACGVANSSLEEVERKLAREVSQKESLMSRVETVEKKLKKYRKEGEEMASKLLRAETVLREAEEDRDGLEALVRRLREEGERQRAKYKDSLVVTKRLVGELEKVKNEAADVKAKNELLEVERDHLGERFRTAGDRMIKLEEALREACTRAALAEREVEETQQRAEQMLGQLDYLKGMLGGTVGTSDAIAGVLLRTSNHVQNVIDGSKRGSSTTPPRPRNHHMMPPPPPPSDHDDYVPYAPSLPVARPPSPPSPLLRRNALSLSSLSTSRPPPPVSGGIGEGEGNSPPKKERKRERTSASTASTSTTTRPKEGHGDSGNVRSSTPSPAPSLQGGKRDELASLLQRCQRLKNDLLIAVTEAAEDQREVLLVDEGLESVRAN